MTDTARTTITVPRAVATALAAPVACAVVALALLAAWAPDLPAPVAVHFGPDGSADNFASLDAVRWSTLLGPALALLLVGLLVAFTRKDPRAARTAVAVASGIGSFVALLPALLTIPQRGVADAADVAFPGWWIVVAAVVGVVAAALAHLAMPTPGPARADTAPRPDAPRIDLGDGERVAWSGTAIAPGWLRLVVGAGPVAVVAVTMAFGRASLAVLIVAAVATAVVLPFVLTPVRVVVDQRGLVARGALPPRAIRVPLDEVAEARVVTVKALNGFGGYGYRIGPAGVGLIARPGPAVEVTRGDGSRFTVTVDDADRGAAVLNTLAARGRV